MIMPNKVRDQRYNKITTIQNVNHVNQNYFVEFRMKIVFRTSNLFWIILKCNFKDDAIIWISGLRLENWEGEC